MNSVGFVMLVFEVIRSFFTVGIRRKRAVKEGDTVVSTSRAWSLITGVGFRADYQYSHKHGRFHDFEGLPITARDDPLQ